MNSFLSGPVGQSIRRWGFRPASAVKSALVIGLAWLGALPCQAELVAYLNVNSRLHRAPLNELSTHPRGTPVGPQIDVYLPSMELDSHGRLWALSWLDLYQWDLSSGNARKAKELIPAGTFTWIAEVAISPSDELWFLEVDAVEDVTRLRRTPLDTTTPAITVAEYPTEYFFYNLAFLGPDLLATRSEGPRGLVKIDQLTGAWEPFGEPVVTSTHLFSLDDRLFTSYTPVGSPPTYDLIELFPATGESERIGGTWALGNYPVILREETCAPSNSSLCLHDSPSSSSLK